MRHHHTEEPFFRIEGTMMGWAVSPNRNPEVVEMCSEIERRGVTQAGVERLREPVVGG